MMTGEIRRIASTSNGEAKQSQSQIIRFGAIMAF